MVWDVRFKIFSADQGQTKIELPTWKKYNFFGAPIIRVSYALITWSDVPTSFLRFDHLIRSTHLGLQQKLIGYYPAFSVQSSPRNLFGDQCPPNVPWSPHKDNTPYERPPLGHLGAVVGAGTLWPELTAEATVLGAGPNWGVKVV